MIHTLQTFGASSGLGALGLNGQQFLIQLVTFIIALFVLQHWAFKPILNMLSKRRELIDSGITLGEKMREREEDLEKKVENELHKARQEADKIIATAHYEAKEAVREAEETARSRADNLIRDAKEQIELATQVERTKLEKEIVGLVSEVSEAIIGEKVDAEKDSELIDRALKQRRAA